ncbi:hypothetical protein BKA82DRAFT_4180698, partial [Pisolithus tinctorius]
MTSWYYRVFLGAPLTSDLARNPSSYVWKTTESTPTPFSPSYVPPHDPTLVYPTATLDEASRRISLLYQNIISKDADDEDGEQIDDSGSDGADREILLTRDDDGDVNAAALASASGLPSFLLTSQSQPLQATYEARETAYSDDVNASSTITRFPNFRIILHSITSLSSLVVAILEVEGPDTVKVKTRPCAGQEVSILKLILGDEEGCYTAEVWGGYGMDPDSPPALARGDVIHFENILETFSHDSRSRRGPTTTTTTTTTTITATTATATASKPSPDAAVRHVGVLVRRFEDLAGAGHSCG